MKAVILGTGSWGTALGQVLADNGADVMLYGINPAEIRDINENHRNSKFFDCPLHEGLRASDSQDIVSDADVIVAAVPVRAMESVLRTTSEKTEKAAVWINVSKGFHPVSHKRMSEVIREIIPAEKRKAVVSLIGPSHAEEVIQRLFTCVCAVSDDEEAAVLVQNLFSNRYFRVYRNTDVIGCETGVAVKNVMALASGILAGIGQGDNARAALMTRGLAEMTRFGTALGGREETFLGLDGVGDLIVTCTSHHSRNFTAGLAIGRDGGAERFLRENTRTVEGIAACRAVHEMAQKMNIEMPITEQVYRILYENASPFEAGEILMGRKLKAE